MLSPSGQKYNDFSPQLRADLEKKMQECGGKAKYKFAIAKKNPEFGFLNMPEVSMHISAPEYIFPAHYDLTPVTFEIKDPHDGKRKKVGMVKAENEKGEATDFRRITLTERDRGMLLLNLTKPDDVDAFAYLELHPSNETGMFFDKDHAPICKQINDVKEAKQSLRKRSLRADAMYVATNMTDAEVKDFASGMNWDEDEDLDILRDKILELADKTPDMYRDLIEAGNLGLRAMIKRAETAGVIEWVPVEYKYVWGSNKQLIAAFGRQENLDPLEKLSEWLISAKNGDAIIAKIKGALKPQTAK